MELSTSIDLEKGYAEKIGLMEMEIGGLQADKQTREQDSSLGAEEGRALQKGDGPDFDYTRSEEGGSQC